jgi:hypothetical protein
MAKTQSKPQSDLKSLAFMPPSTCRTEFENTVNGFLSQDKDRSNKELTHILCSHCLSQLPQHFKIVPLTSKITSWLILLLLWLPIKQQLTEAHLRTKPGCGGDTLSTACLLVLKISSSSTECQETKRLRSWELSLWLYAFRTSFCFLVLKFSQQYPQPFGCNLQGKWKGLPKTQRRT